MQPKYTILIVEDEPLLLRIVKSTLERAEFKILTARDGEEALTLYAQHQSEIALIISSVALPKIAGWTLYLQLKEMKPGVKMIFISGYFDPGFIAKSATEGIHDLIQKRFRLDELVRIARSRVP
jgi:two-component system cell cycle sensor histidine kinase/response regulator CckA